MARLSGEHWQDWKFTCGMVAMIYRGLETNAVAADRVPLQVQRYQKYLTGVKCIMRFIGRPVVVKHLVLWNYHAREGVDDEGLIADLDRIAEEITHQRRHRTMTLLGRALWTANVLEEHVPREIGLEIASY